MHHRKMPAGRASLHRRHRHAIDRLMPFTGAPLFHALQLLATSDSARFHMPGHKGQPVFNSFRDVFAIDYTETHQVIVSVGYGEGAEIAERLEQNNVIVNYQATPDEEGFTASGALRMGVSEMTRFGFEEKDFDQLASLMADCILRGREIKADVEQLRARHTEMRYCFDDAAINDALEQLAGKLDI